MSWTYLQEEEEACWQEPSLTGAPSALLKLIPIEDRLYSLANEMESYHDSPFGMTYEPSTDPGGTGTSTSSLEDSPAKTSARQVNVKDLPEKVRALSLKCSESLEKYDLRLCSRKTVRTFVPAASVRSSTDLPAWGMWDESGYWELGTSVRTTKERECGLLPTPTGQGNELAPSMQKWPGHQRLMKWLEKLPTPVASEADRGHCPSEAKRRTPMLKTQVIQASQMGILPTPTAQLYGSNQGGGSGRTGKKGQSLESITGGVLLALREWMMGWVIGWSALEPLEMDGFRKWQESFGIFSDSKEK